LAARRGSLAISGAICAVLVGTTIYAGGGPAWFATLAVFFFTSTLLGRVERAKKAADKREYEKSDTRDGAQVLANGGVAAAAALGMMIAPDPHWAGAFLGALAAANGDTWATELGVLSSGEPRSLRTLRRVPRGTSGAVSGLGLLATMGGAAAIGVVAVLAPGAFGLATGRAFVAALFAGTLGSLADSLLGATLQASYRCDVCSRNTEAPRHHCGAVTRRVRGLSGVGNDAVNLAATLIGALVGAASI
jgi:uncharacterized protein (TIGR00297 family)